MDQQSRQRPRDLSVLFAVLALLSALLAGCTTDDSGERGAIDLSPFAGRTFVSQEVVRNGVAFALVEGTELTIGFRTDPDWVFGDAGCNHFDGGVQFDDAVMQVPMASWTAMYCFERTEQEDWYFAFLSGGPSVKFDGTTLTLRRKADLVRYIDEEVAHPDTPLVGTSWEARAVPIAGSFMLRGSWDPPATMRLDATGSVDVFDGCAAGKASVAVDGATLKLGEWAWQAGTCADKDQTQLQAAVRLVLRSGVALEWNVDRDDLVIGDGSQHIEFARSEPTP
ncbi:MAG: META domain-containing protein [Deltaproteobacteria bacterium]|nr:META domain-containing protein [Deltaproteobacteria bacterium]